MSEGNAELEPQQNDEQLYVLAVLDPSLPEGYFPVGTYDEILELYVALLKNSRGRKEDIDVRIRLYQANVHNLPEFIARGPEFTETLRAVLRGDETVPETVSSALKAAWEDVSGVISRADGSMQDTLKVISGAADKKMRDLMRLYSRIQKVKKGIGDISDSLVKNADEIMEYFSHSNPEGLLSESGSRYVQIQWVAIPGNAEPISIDVLKKGNKPNGPGPRAPGL